MPTIREADGTIYPIRSEISLFRSFFRDSRTDRPHLTFDLDRSTSENDLFTDPLMGLGGSLVGDSGGGENLMASSRVFDEEINIDGNARIITLSPEEQEAINGILHVSRGGDARGWDHNPMATSPYSGADDPLLLQFNREVQRLYSNITVLTNPGYDGANTGQETGSARASASSQPDEMFRSVQETLSGLRDFIQIQQPGSGLLMTSDSNRGYSMIPELSGVFLNNESTMALPRRDDLSGGTAERTSLSTAHSLPRTLWNMAISTVALVIYAIIIICWIAWRYVISRYA